MAGKSWVTLATNDTYSIGALVLAHSLLKVNTSHKLVILVTPGVTSTMRSLLQTVFNEVREVDVLDSRDEANLRLLARPELGVTFTKLHCWRLTHYDKCVFLDADTLVLKNCDELFDREELSAAPDVGWPDCFNSGLFVFKPSEETYKKLIDFALSHGSFDGGDQGLLNMFFSDWSTADISKHLPFVYNLCSAALYSYLPAFKWYGKDIKIMHFIGGAKPWLQYFNSETRTVRAPNEAPHLQGFLQLWWDILCTNVHPALSSEMTEIRLSSWYNNSTQYFNRFEPYYSPPVPEPEEHFTFTDPWDDYKTTQDEFDSSYSDCSCSCTTDNTYYDIPLNTSDWAVSDTNNNYYKSTSAGSNQHPPSTVVVNTHNQLFYDTRNNNSVNTISTIINRFEKSNSITTVPSVPCTASTNDNCFYADNITIFNTSADCTRQNHSEYSTGNFKNNNTIFNENQSSEPQNPVTLNARQADSLIVPMTLHNSDYPSCPASTNVIFEDTGNSGNDTEYIAICNDLTAQGGVACTLSELKLGEPLSLEQLALEDHLRRQSWEQGNIDYMGKDSFDNIWQKIQESLSTTEETNELAPAQAPIEESEADKPIEFHAAPSSGEEPVVQETKHPIESSTPLMEPLVTQAHVSDLALTAASPSEKDSKLPVKVTADICKLPTDSALYDVSAKADEAQLHPPSPEKSTSELSSVSSVPPSSVAVQEHILTPAEPPKELKHDLKVSTPPPIKETYVPTTVVESVAPVVSVVPTEQMESSKKEPTADTALQFPPVPKSELSIEEPAAPSPEVPEESKPPISSPAVPELIQQAPPEVVDSSISKPSESIETVLPILQSGPVLPASKLAEPPESIPPVSKPAESYDTTPPAAQPANITSSVQAVSESPLPKDSPPVPSTPTEPKGEPITPVEAAKSSASSKQEPPRKEETKPPGQQATQSEASKSKSAGKAGKKK